VDIRLMLEKLAKDEGMTILISSHILSELSELCTDFVFVNHGCLIEELSAEELSQKTGRFIRIKTDNIDNTAAILENSLGIRNYKVNHEGELLLYERLDDIKTVSKTITDAGQIITRFNPESESLEDYYMRMVGERSE
jgi:ABC-2 type transport system ATP-binding protein